MKRCFRQSLVNTNFYTCMLLHEAVVHQSLRDGSSDASAHCSKIADPLTSCNSLSWATRLCHFLASNELRTLLHLFGFGKGCLYDHHHTNTLQSPPPPPPPSNPQSIFWSEIPKNRCRQLITRAVLVAIFFEKLFELLQLVSYCPFHLIQFRPPSKLCPCEWVCVCVWVRKL